jgi:hypothetical protein
MKASILKDLTAPIPQPTLNLYSATSVPTPKGSKNKFKVKLRKSGPPVDGSELRMSSVALVKLTNLECLISRFDELISTLPLSTQASSTILRKSSLKPLPLIPTYTSDFPDGQIPTVMNPSQLHSRESTDSISTPPPLPPRRTSQSAPTPTGVIYPKISEPRYRLLPPRIPIYLTLTTCADMPIVRPYTTQFSVSFHTCPNKVPKDEGTSEYFAQSRRPITVNSTIPMILSQEDWNAGIQCRLHQSINESNYIVASGCISLPDLRRVETDARNGFKVSTNLGGGKITCKILIVGVHQTEVVRDRVKFVVNDVMNIVQEAMVDKVCILTDKT